MQHLFIRITTSLFLGLLLSSCASKVITPDVPITDPDAAWGRVLQRYVDSKGRINFFGLSKNMTDLHMVVAHISKVSPSSHPNSYPTKEHSLAYYLNAYNALAMFNIVRFEIPKDNDSFLKRFRFFYVQRFAIGGEYMSLYDLENDIVRPLGDARVHVALNCMVRGCPRLPQEPFQPRRLEAQIEKLAQEFFNEERNVQVDTHLKIVRLSEILDFFTKDFLKKHPSLIAYVNQYRQDKIPEDYKVKFIPYDWTTNLQTMEEPRKLTSALAPGTY